MNGVGSLRNQLNSCSKYILLRTCAVFLLLLLLGSTIIAGRLSFTAEAPDMARDKEALIAIEHQWLDSIERHDVKLLSSLLDDDFIDTTVYGCRRSKYDVLTSVRVRNFDTQTLQNLTVHLHGDVGIVNGENFIVGGHHSFTATVHFTDVFKKCNHQWKAIAAQESLPASR